MKLSEAMNNQKTNTVAPTQAKITVPQTASTGKLSSFIADKKVKPLVQAPVSKRLVSGSTPIAETKMPTTLERIGNTVSGAAKDFVGGLANAGQLADKIPLTPAWQASKLNSLIFGESDVEKENKEKAKAFADTLTTGGAKDIAEAKRGATGIGKTAIDVGVGGLQLAGDIGLAALTGGGSIAPMVVRSFGSAAKQAENSGASETAQIAYGGLTAATAGLVGKLSNVGGVLSKAYGKGVLDKTLETATNKAINRFISSKAGQAVAQRLATGVTAGVGEGFEEMLESTLSPLYQKITYDPNATWNAEQILYDGLVGALVGGFAGGIGGSNAQLVPNNVQNQGQNVQKPIDNQTNVATPIVPNVNTIAPNLQTAKPIVTPQQAAQAPVSNVNPQTTTDTAKVAETSVVEQVKPQAPLKGDIQPLTANKAKLPDGVGANSAKFGYKEAPTQSKAYDSIYTDMEKAAIPELQNTHQVKTDEGVDARVQERLDSDYEGEKDDLFNSKQDWDVDDTRLAAKILENEVAKSRETDNWDEAIKAQKKYDAEGTDWGQVGRQRQRFANTPTEIILEAAVTLSNIETEEKGKARTSKQKVEDDKAKEQSDKAGKAAHEATKETADKMSKSYTNHTKKARLPRLKTIEGNQAGEPFTFEYEEKVGETLANSIEKSLSSKPKQQTFLKEIASQLKAYAKETMPEKAKSTSAKVTATDRLNDYLANKEFYSNAWSLAQDELRRRYAGNPDMLTALEDFTNSTIGFRGNPSDRNSIMIRSLVNSAIESGETKQVLRLQEALGFTKTSENIANDLIKRTGATDTDAEIIRSAASQYVNDVLATSELDATKTVNAKVKSAMHDIGLTISETVTKNAKQKASISEAVTKLLVNKYGIGSADASNVAKVVTEHFNTMVSEATQKKLESIFNKTKTTPNIKPYMQKLTEMMNMGVFDNSQYSEAAAEKLFGLKVEESRITSEKFKGLMKTISEKADTLNNIKKGDTASTIKLIKELNTIRKTTGMFTTETSKFMSDSLNWVAENSEDADTFLRDVAAAQLRNVASDYNKTSTFEAIKTLRFMNVLSKLATYMRNITSNFILDPTETLVQNTFVWYDIALSKMTGTRAVPVDKSWFSKSKRKGSTEGFYRSAIQVGLDADATGDTSKNETHTGRTFKMTGNPLERFLSTWDKYEKYGLQSTDEFSKGGIAAESKRGNAGLESRGLAPKGSLADVPMEIAKERTLQNDGVTAQALGKVKEGANYFKFTDKQGGKFGLGDLGFMFTKIPANATAMTAKYLPVTGLTNAAYNFAKTWKQAKNGTLTVEQQRRAVMALGRATNGAAGVAMLTGLAIKGLIRVAGSDDKDEEALEKSEGQNGTQFNLSATMRYMTGGSAEWQDGDSIAAIGYIEHLNGQMIMASMIADAYKDDKNVSLGDIANANAGAIFQSVMELPALSQLTSIANGYRYSQADEIGGKLADAGGSFLASQVSSFLIPNAVAGVAQGLDNTVRNTYSNDKWYDNAKDSVLSKIPFARNTLPAKITPMGTESKTTDKPILNMLNSNILPGAIGIYKTNEVNQELFKLDEKYPARSAPSSIETFDKEYELTATEKDKFQKTYGQQTYRELDKLFKSSEYKSMTADDKTKAVTEIYSTATYNAKQAVIEARGELFIPNADVGNKIAKYQSAGITQRQAYNLSKTMATLTPEQGEKEVSDYQRIKTIGGQGYTDAQAIALVGTLYTSKDKTSLLPYLTTSKHLLSLYLTNKDSEMISMSVPSKVTQKSVEYELTDKEKETFKNVYANYFNSRVNNVTSAAAIKKLRDKAFDAAKLAVINGR